jgi:polysaccharide export outer membrane protein
MSLLLIEYPMKYHRSHLAICLLCLISRCLAAGQKYTAPPPEFFQSNAAGKLAKILPGDTLTVRFYYNPELNKTTRVRDDGKISLDLFQGISVAGQTPEELQKNLEEMYSREFTNPRVTVDIDSHAVNSAYVTGEVLIPGAKELHGKMTIGMVLALSQVAQKNASMKSVLLIRGTPEGKHTVYKLDASFSDGAARDVIAQPGDILFVPRKGIVKADDFIEQYVRQLLPATPNASIYYAVGNTASTTATLSH